MENEKSFVDKYWLYIFIIILLVSFYLRLRYFNINTAIWYDEGSYLNLAKKWGLGLSYLNDDFYFRRTFFLPIIFTGMYWLFGNNELPLRVLELLFSTGTVIFIYLLIKEMFDKKHALVASFIFGVSWLSLFFTARLLTNGPDLFFMTAGLYFFWKGYANDKGKWNIWLAGLFFGLGIFTRFASAIMLIPIFLYIFTKDKFGAIKNKHLWLMAIILLLILTPFFINFFSYKGDGAGVGGFLKHYFADRDILIFKYVVDLGYILQGLFLLLFIGGLSYFINIFLCANKAFQNEEVRKGLFIAVWIILPFIIFGLITSMVEERYLMLTLPFVSFLIAYFCLKIPQYLKVNATISTIIILVLLGIGAYSQIAFADKMIGDKKDSFYELRQAGEWLKTNSNKGDWIISSGQPELMYYSERNIESFTSTEEQFQEKIDRLKPKYMILTAWEQSPEWVYSYAEKNKGKTVLPVMGWKQDGQDQYTTVVFTFIYNSTG